MSPSHRILLINQYAGSPRDGMEFRPHALAREWQATGHDVLIVAGSPSHVRTHNPELTRRVSREIVDGVEFEWLRLPRYDGNGGRRAANVVAFAGQLWARGRALADDFRPDVVIASSTHPLDIYGARCAARRSGARLVFEVHDLWPLTPVELGGMSPAHPFIRLMARAERDACASADSVVSILPAADRHLVTRGMPLERYAHVPNGISIAEADAGDPLPGEQAELVRSLRADGHFLVGYAGGIGLANAIDDLVAAAERLRGAPVAFLIWGDGPERLALERQAAGAGLTHVRFLGRIPKPSVRAALEACDALYLGWKRRSVYRFGVSPNKLFDYMAAARPIVHATSAPGDPVAECGCGVSVEAEDPAALALAIEQIASLAASERAELGARGRREAEEHHDYPILAARFLDAVTRSSRAARTMVGV
ncbi:MAG TPA: glycosyltransferase family 4 protein [Gaiellales bacterium]|nr:glycosyltransferase family 4 protein [Gaiellales bacterium]